MAVEVVAAAVVVVTAVAATLAVAMTNNQREQLARPLSWYPENQHHDFGISCILVLSQS